MMNRMSRSRVSTAVHAALIYAVCLAWPMSAQSQSAQVIKAPKTQLWMDVGTGSKPELELALWNSRRPGVPVRMEIPSGMLMGDSLTLTPSKSDAVDKVVPNELPKGRLLSYWGCSATVQTGQPRSIDFTTPNSANAAAYASALLGTYVPEQDASIKPGFVVYPIEPTHNKLPKGASLVGTHRLRGEDISLTFAFNLAGEHDVMPSIELHKLGSLQDNMTLGWFSVTGARAYFLQAVAKQGDDTIVWTSSALPDAGTAIFNYLSNATLDRWVKDRLLLDASAKECAIPKGILAGQGAVLRIMAFGGEHNLTFPARPANPKVIWEPEWSVRLRLQSQATMVLGESNPASLPTKNRDILPPHPAILLRDPTNLLRGILGG